MPKYRIEIRVEADDLKSIPNALDKINTTDLLCLQKCISICNEDTNMWEDLSSIFDS